MAIERTMHMAIAIGLLEKMDDDTIRDCFAGPKDRPTIKACRAKLAEWRKLGYEYCPPCDDVDEKGVCRGHGLAKVAE